MLTAPTAPPAPTPTPVFILLLGGELGVAPGGCGGAVPGVGGAAVVPGGADVPGGGDVLGGGGAAEPLDGGAGFGVAVVPGGFNGG